MRLHSVTIDKQTTLYIQSKHNRTIILWDLDSGNKAPGSNEQGSNDDLAAEGFNLTYLTLLHKVWKCTVDATVNHTVDAPHKVDISLLMVAQCLDNTYGHVGNYSERDATWTCKGAQTPLLHLVLLLLP